MERESEREIERERQQRREKRVCALDPVDWIPQFII